MTAGGIRRRCRCRDDNGKDLGSKCPKLSQRSHGAWQLRHELAQDEAGKRRTFRRNGFETKGAAQVVLDDLRTLLALADDEDDREAITQLLTSLGPKDSLPTADEVSRKLRAGQALGDKITVGEWLERWLKQETHRKATEVSYESHVRLYLKPLIGDKRLDRLTVGHLVEMFNAIDDGNDKIEAANADRRALVERIKATSSRADKRALRAELAALPPFRRPVGPSSRQRIRATLRAAINDAIVQQLCTFNPAQHVQIPTEKPRPLIWTAERVEEWQTTGQRPSSVMVWTPAQAGAFLDYVAEHDPEFEAMWHVMVFRGPRRGEVAGLAWTEVRLDAGTVQISNQITEVEYKIAEGAPKSEAGIRTIPLDAESLRLLKAHRKRQVARKLELGTGWVDSGKVFTGDDGAHLRPSWIGDRFEKLYATAGLPPIRLHDLRHVAATLMLAAKVEMKVVQETLGHSVMSTTSDLYTSVLPELAQAAAEQVVTVVPRAPKVTPGRPSGTPDADSGPMRNGGDRRGDEKVQVDGGLSAV